MHLHQVVNVTDQYVCVCVRIFVCKMVYSFLAKLPRQVLVKKACFSTETVLQECVEICVLCSGLALYVNSSVGHPPREDCVCVIKAQIPNLIFFLEILQL